MNVWVVTRRHRDDYDDDQDVFVGVALSPLGALALVDDGREHRKPTRFELNPEAGTVTSFVTYTRADRSDIEFADDVWTIREIEPTP